MTGRSSIWSPSNQPIFEGLVVRNPTRVQQQGGGGAGEFPFQWSWPGLVNFTSAGVAIPTIAGSTLSHAYYTLISGGSTITVGIYINGVLQDSVSFSASGDQAITSAPAAAGDRVGIAVTSVGSGAGVGLWFGLAP